MGHSEGIMRPLMLALGATPLVGVPALIALGPVLLPAQVQPQELKHWVTATGLDFATLLFGLAAVLLIGAALGVVFATRAQRRRERALTSLNRHSGVSAACALPPRAGGAAKWVDRVSW